MALGDTYVQLKVNVYRNASQGKRVKAETNIRGEFTVDEMTIVVENMRKELDLMRTLEAAMP